MIGDVRLTLEQWCDMLESNASIRTRIKDILKDYRSKIGFAAREAAKASVFPAHVAVCDLHAYCCCQIIFDSSHGSDDDWTKCGMNNRRKQHGRT